MKSGRDLDAVRAIVEEAGLLETTSLVANCGLEDEALYPRFADVPANMSDYFTLVIAKEPK